MGRPSDWAPLGCARDPVPGDPDAVSAEAAHLRGVARQITGQVIALRAIGASAGSGSMAGAYGRKLQAAAGDVAGQLTQAAVRYERASAALEQWVPELADAQAVSLRALTMAEAPYLTLKNLVPPRPMPGAALTAAQEQDRQTYQRLSQRAQTVLDEARALAAHTVMLGHSYGSLVVGEAAVRAPGKLADALAFVGSPGVGVNRASELGVPASHVFAGAAANDPVPDLPPVSPVGWFDGSSHFGTNPAFPQFGARDFYVDPGKSISVTDPIGAHSQYWDANSAALKNLARITTGQYTKIQWAASP
jgi:hypothetical protein